MTNQDWITQNEALGSKIDHLQKQVKKISTKNDQLITEWNRLATEFSTASTVQSYDSQLVKQLRAELVAEWECFDFLCQLATHELVTPHTKSESISDLLTYSGDQHKLCPFISQL